MVAAANRGKGGAKYNRIDSLNRSFWIVCAHGKRDVVVAWDIKTGEDLCASVTAEENDLFVKCGNTINSGRGRATAGIEVYGYKKIEDHVYRIVATVKCNRFYIDGHVDNLAGAGSYAGCIVDLFLVGGAKTHP